MFNLGLQNIGKNKFLDVIISQEATKHSALLLYLII